MIKGKKSESKQKIVTRIILDVSELEKIKRNTYHTEEAKAMRHSLRNL
jgi:hypothetical protein